MQINEVTFKASATNYRTNPSFPWMQCISINITCLNYIYTISKTCCMEDLAVKTRQATSCFPTNTTNAKVSKCGWLEGLMFVPLSRKKYWMTFHETLQ